MQANSVFVDLTNILTIEVYLPTLFLDLECLEKALFAHNLSGYKSMQSLGGYAISWRL